MIGIAIDIWNSVIHGASNPHPGVALLLEDGFLFLLETGTDTLLLE